MTRPVFLIDSDVLITAKNLYYAFRICPGFWECLLDGFSKQRVYSIDRVKQELLAGRPDDHLYQWADEKMPSEFFRRSADDAVVDAYGKVMLWVTRSSQYYDDAKAKFASGADGWLVAHGMVTGGVVVTNEDSRPESRNQIKLPDVCSAFGVRPENTFAMLHELEAEFTFEPNAP